MSEFTPPDVFSEGAEAGTRIAMVLAMGANQVISIHKQKAEERAAQAEAQRQARAVQNRAKWAELRSKWLPALDDRALASADLLQTAQLWGAAAPYAEYHREANMAVEQAEARLRELRPQTMSVYDRLRNEVGLSRADAMAQVAPMFEHSDARAHHPRNIEADLLAENPMPAQTNKVDGAELSIADAETKAAAFDVASVDNHSTPAVDEHSEGQTAAARHNREAAASQSRANSPQHTNQAAELANKSKPPNGWGQARTKTAGSARRSNSTARRNRRSMQPTRTHGAKR